MNNAGRVQPRSPTPWQARESNTWPVQAGSATSVVVVSLDDLRAFIDDAVAGAFKQFGLPAPGGEPAPTPALPEYLTTRQAAALLGCTARHLENMRGRSDGPPYVRIGRMIRYPLAGLREHGNRQKVHNA